MKRSAIVLLAALAVSAPPVFAGLFDDKEARAAVERLRVDVDALTERVERASRNQIDFANQSEALKSDLARVRGQLEVLLNEIESTQKRQRDFYVDLDTRLRKLETSAAAPAPESKAADTPRQDPAMEGRDYETALGLFKAGKYKEAEAAFLAFIKSWPSSSLLPNAHYWAASSHFQLKDYKTAADMFAKVVATWPNSDKAPDSLLAQGNALSESGDAKGARKTLEALVAQYPMSTAAQTAKQRLKKK
jgi:tol-pal system protein YbgF